MVKPASSGREQKRAVQQALARAHWFPEEVDYVNACGLGMLDSDAREVSTLKQALGSHACRVPISSFKGALGHAFAASGAFQVIGTALALAHQFVPPTLNLTEADPDCELNLVAGEGRPVAMRRALINSFGFGGKNVVLAMSGAQVGAARGRTVNREWAAAHSGQLAGIS